MARSARWTVDRGGAPVEHALRRQMAAAAEADRREIPAGPGLFRRQRRAVRHVGLEAVAHYYNQAREWHGGIDVVLSRRSSARSSGARSSRMSSADASTKSGPSRGRPTPASATGTTTAASTSSNGYKSAKQVIQRLVDVVVEERQPAAQHARARRRHDRRQGRGDRRWHRRVDAA